MGISCANGGTFADNSTCRTDGSTDFRGVVTPQLRAFEDRVLGQHFEGASVPRWERSPHYHAYHLVNVIAVGGTTPMSTIWHEFARRPAPTIGLKSRPARTGERSMAMAAPVLGRGRGIPIPLPGGPVKHYVERGLLALINATMFGHVLHEGHIMRWLVRKPDSSVECHTVGRGTTRLARTNETMGLEIFDDLDMRIRAALSN